MGYRERTLVKCDGDLDIKDVLLLLKGQGTVG
jgi:hypothetical protein